MNKAVELFRRHPFRAVVVLAYIRTKKPKAALIGLLLLATLGCSAPDATPVPTSTIDIQATVDAAVRATIQALPTATPVPTATHVPEPTRTATPTDTPVPPTATSLPTATLTPYPTSTPTVAYDQARNSLISHLMHCIVGLQNESTRESTTIDVFNMPIGEGKYNLSAGRWELVGPGVKWDADELKRGAQVFDIVETIWFAEWPDIWPSTEVGVDWWVYFCPGRF